MAQINQIVNKGVSLATKYADDIGIGVRKWTKPTNLEGLRFSPKAIGDNIHAFPNSQSKYMQRQLADIEKFGKREFKPENELATKAMDFFTPHRRLSKKPCSLSDAPYFIKEFEKKTGMRFLPSNWTKMSEAEKVDYIVHERYNQRVASRCMDAIKDAPVEHGFSIRQDGEIFSYRKGETGSVSMLFEPEMIGVHNHPSYKSINLEEAWAVDIPRDTYIKNTAESISYHSEKDIINHYCHSARKSYVVDSNGHKLLLESNNMPNNELITALFKYYFKPEYKRTLLSNLTRELVMKQKLIELNTHLKSLDKSSLEYKQLTKEFEELVYQTHNGAFGKRIFETLSKLIDDFSGLFSWNEHSGMRLSQLT